jgi:uncharacterized FlgJ-related protein
MSKKPSGTKKTKTFLREVNSDIDAFKKEIASIRNYLSTVK